jgi:hypothetical protein
MALNEFKEKVVTAFCEKITDKVFLMIQNDKELMHEYLHIVEENPPLRTVNSAIANEIRRRFDLISIGESDNPESFLIQGHEKFRTNHE